MKVAIEVENRREGEALKVGLADPATRAIVVAMGLLLALPSARARKRVLSYVAERLEEEQGLVPESGE